MTPLLKAPVTSKRLKIEYDKSRSKLCFTFQLATLHLGFNQLKTVPKELGGLTALTSLRLDNNQLTILPPELGALNALTRLDLQSNVPELKEGDLPPDVKALSGPNDSVFSEDGGNCAIRL